MTDLILDIGLDPKSLLITLILSSICVFSLYNRFRFTVLDSLVFFMLAQIANLSIIVTFPMDHILRWHLLSYMLALWIGFAFNGRPLKGVARPLLDATSFHHLRLLMMVLAAVIIFANLYLGVTAGFPLLSSNPSEAKFTVYSGGLGLVRRLNMGPYIFLCAGCSLMIARGVCRRQMALTLASATLLNLMSGSKSALLPVLFSLSFAFSHPGAGLSQAIRRKTTMNLGILLGAAAILAALVATKDQGGLQGGLQQLVIRLLYNADVVFYYVPRRDEIAALVSPHFSGFLHNAFGEVLGLLRLSDYDAALGSVIQNTDVGGTNVQYFVQADLFMGPVLGVIYCMIIGYAISWLRANFLRNHYRSALLAATALYFALIASDMATEFGLFVSEVFITAVFILPLYVLIVLFQIAFQDVDTISGKSPLTFIKAAKM